ncbi:MAG TPA: glycosyltransferase family A protein [Rhodanobacteraceae bacterium]|nr:glycosyltransferase family A protein [Rhodanobacteraceae bacterium]
MISVIIPVYRDANRAMALAEILCQQQLPTGCPLEIIVVDDGSGDGTTTTLRRIESRQVRILALPQNRGRAHARSAGAYQARGSFLVFIDCDCQPTNSGFLAAHLRRLEGSCIATCGPVIGNGSGFWSRYQQVASARRRQLHSRGITYAGSTQNFAVRRSAFLSAGGFDTRYRDYGFEDRDLFVRLARIGEIGWCADATVRHLDELDLPSALEKMRLAAGDSAVLFSRDHPEAYRALGYAAIDARLHVWLRPISALLKPLLRAAPPLDRQLKRGRMPFALAKATVKLLAALAFARGSAEKRPERSL